MNEQIELLALGIVKKLYPVGVYGRNNLHIGP